MRPLLRRRIVSPLAGAADLPKMAKASQVSAVLLIHLGLRIASMLNFFHDPRPDFEARIASPLAILRNGLEHQPSNSRERLSYPCAAGPIQGGKSQGLPAPCGWRPIRGRFGLLRRAFSSLLTRKDCQGAAQKYNPLFYPNGCCPLRAYRKRFAEDCQHPAPSAQSQDSQEW